MAIESVGSMNKILSNYNSKDWVKSAELDGLKNSEFSKLLKVEELDATEKSSFSDLMMKSVSNVNSLQEEANTAIQKLVTGESKNIHETMLAVEKADIAFKTMNQIRMKVIDAYKEIMRMQV